MLSKSELPSMERKQKIESIYLFHKSNLSMYSTSAQRASKSCSSSPTTSKCRCLICISDKNILRSFPKRTKWFFLEFFLNFKGSPLQNKCLLHVHLLSHCQHKNGWKILNPMVVTRNLVVSHLAMVHHLTAVPSKFRI